MCRAISTSVKSRYSCARPLAVFREGLGQFLDLLGGVLSQRRGGDGVESFEELVVRLLDASDQLGAARGDGGPFGLSQPLIRFPAQFLDGSQMLRIASHLEKLAFGSDVSDPDGQLFGSSDAVDAGRQRRRNVALSVMRVPGRDDSHGKENSAKNHDRNHQSNQR